MNGGELTLCLACKDLTLARQFYEVLGMQAENISEESLLMRNGHSRLALMTFLPRNSLNFRGADPFVLADAFKAAGFESEEDPLSYKAEQLNASADGVCWSIHDPAGNHVFIDTNAVEISEQGRQQRISQLLKATEQELRHLGASDECLKTFQSEMVDQFA